MDRKELVQSINDEIAKLQKAAALLSGEPQRTAIRDERGRVSGFSMNASARKRISDAQKERWERTRNAALLASKAPAKKISRKAAAKTAPAPQPDNPPPLITLNETLQ
jgi:hypothetical protein